MFQWLQSVVLAGFFAGGSVSAAEPADSLVQWRQRHAEIRVAPDPDFAPIDATDANGQHHGLAADYLRLISERSGLKFRIVPVRSWPEALSALRERRVDMLSSAFVTATREEFALFSVPYLRLPCAAFSRKGRDIRLEQLNELAVGLAQEHVCQENLARQAPQAKVTFYPSTSKALTALHQGKIDVLVGDLVTAQAAANRAGIRGDLVVVGQIGEDDPLAFAVRRDWPELKQILDQALGQVSVEDETRLRQRWLKDLLPGVQTAAPAPAAEPQASSLAGQIRAAKQALGEATAANADAHRAAVGELDAALADDAQADAANAEWQALRTAAASAAADLAALEQGLARDNTANLLAWRASLPERASVEQLESLLATEQAQLADARSAVTALQGSVTRQLERPAQIRDEMKSAQDLAEKSRSAPEAAKDAPALGVEPARLRRLAAARLAQARIAKLEEELRSYDLRVRLESARLRERQREAADRQSKVEALQNLILDRTSAIAATLNERLQREAAALADAHPVLREPARLNAAYGDELAQDISRLAEIRTQKDEYARLRRDTVQALENTRERVKFGGVSEAVGLILLAERRKLQPVAVLRRKLSALQTELAQTRIRLVDLREAQRALEDPTARVAEELRRVPQDGEADPTLRQALYQLFATRAEVLPQLTLAQTRLADAQTEAEQELRDLTQSTADLRDMLDARLLWTPSHSPVNARWPLEIVNGAIDTLHPGRWWDAAKLTARLLWTRPLSTLLGVAVLTALWLARRRVPAALEAIAQPMRRIRTDRYRLTGRALLLTLLASLPLPAAVWMLSRLLQRAAEAGYPFSDALGLALGELVAPLATLSFLRWLTADRGLAAAHFRWAQGRRHALDTLRRWLTAVFAPVHFFLSLYFYYGEQLANAGLARLVFAGSSLLLAWLIWRSFTDTGLWAQRGSQNTPRRLQQILRVLLTGFALSCAVLALAGYFLTAVTLARHLVGSGIVVLAIGVLQGMAMRWLSLGERRLALKRMEEKRGSEEATRDDGELETRAEFAAEAEQITLASINQQTRRLLRALTTVVLAGALLWVWSEVTPALAFLGNVNAWETTYAVDGKSITITVTLRSLLFAAVAFMLTWVATRNIPGLLEIGVLRRLDLDAPTRYAVTAVSRYALAIVGALFGLSLLGLRWGQLQWLAAGLTVGLGFGLQEIFANFVSGLIVLFERPIRVGDVITIRGVEGTVMRIRTRATTIVDWDNKEVVIPNKTFITDQLINWTLSDSVTRVVLKVGVAYNSDPDLVRTLLLEMARNHPKVLKDPPPSCWFTALGSSTLEFELRIFVAHLFERSATRNDLYTAILREFAARGIEMSYPAMDVWVREANPLAPPGRRPDAAAASPAQPR
ncbi:mechanosensitive ion channel domain-containing protein [Tahibacter amnicola]|uniref:Mechanosensitive ion channel n=1 Tax=Tahibacter amnicola TaxID=2976241 RepID=A0ABY6BH06_9GAMM|nr:transporter substrate-binding domain-containing protein [Tahibacter amnicola]UXI67886.1 mechanosensitive ion channel [Tahibacter amnicola]